MCEREQVIFKKKHAVNSPKNQFVWLDVNLDIFRSLNLEVHSDIFLSVKPHRGCWLAIKQ